MRLKSEAKVAFVRGHLPGVQRILTFAANLVDSGSVSGGCMKDRRATSSALQSSDVALVEGESYEEAAWIRRYLTLADHALAEDEPSQADNSVIYGQRLARPGRLKVMHPTMRF
jgi:hypothetical protein